MIRYDMSPRLQAVYLLCCCAELAELLAPSPGDERANRAIELAIGVCQAIQYQWPTDGSQQLARQYVDRAAATLRRVSA